MTGPFVNGITASCGGLLATEREWFTTKTMIDEQLKIRNPKYQRGAVKIPSLTHRILPA
jgi:hypothetical protein